MKRTEIISAIEGINIWKSGSQRAPHKPLLILYALGQWVNHEKRRIPYAEVDTELRRLLMDFGPQRKSFHPEYPFWRLQNDGIWLLDNIEGIQVRKGSSDARKSELIRLGVTGGFSTDYYTHFKEDPALVYELAHQILEARFPDTMHQDILQAVGLKYQYTFKKKPLRTRDPAFRYRVLVAYEHRCAVCGFDVQMGSTLVGVEAAHIKWHQAGGPDVPENGFALCSIHHKLLDRGAYTINHDREVQVSEHAHGSTGLEEWLLRYHRRMMRDPVSHDYFPKDEYIEWHNREVFHGPARRLDTVSK